MVPYFFTDLKSKKFPPICLRLDVNFLTQGQKVHIQSQILHPLFSSNLPPQYFYSILIFI